MTCCYTCNLYTYSLYRSEEASSEMEALAKASHNPDEIILGEDDEDDEQEVEGNLCMTHLYT